MLVNCSKNRLLRIHKLYLQLFAEFVPLITIEAVVAVVIHKLDKLLYFGLGWRVFPSRKPFVEVIVKHKNRTGYFCGVELARLVLVHGIKGLVAGDAKDVGVSKHASADGKADSNSDSGNHLQDLVVVFLLLRHVVVAGDDDDDDNDKFPSHLFTIRLDRGPLYR